MECDKMRSAVEPIKNSKDLDLLFRNIRNPRNKLIAIIAYFACLRISDVLKLRVSDITKNELNITEGKTGKNKKVEINGAFKKLIDDLLPRWTIFVKKKWGVILEDDSYIFISAKSKLKPVRREQVWRFIKSECEKIGIKKAGSHSMRKSSAWKTYSKHGIAGAQKVCNHSSPNETIAYLGVTDEFTKQIFNDLSNDINFK